MSLTSMQRLKKQSSEAKKRLQHQLYLARECPEPVFDLSSCELTEVPSGVYSLCKVLQKEVLLLHTNRLVNLKGGGNLSDLCTLRILDLHNNRLTVLPEVWNSLTNLQVLHVDNNQLTSLPASLSALRSLQTLTAKKNLLKTIPGSLSELRCLRTLDVSANDIVTLPKELGKLKTLESLTVDTAKLKYPHKDVASGGTEVIMKFFCKELGIEYCAPSTALLPILPDPAKLGADRSRSYSANESEMRETILQYENLKEKRRRERLALEAQLEEDQRQQALLAAHAHAQKHSLIQAVTLEHARMHREIEVAQQMKDAERNRLLGSLYEAEKNASELVSRLLEMNEKVKKTEELLEQMERERMEAEQWIIVRQEELENLRKKDILASMQKILKENDKLEAVILKYLNSKDAAVFQTLQTYEENEGKFSRLLSDKSENQRKLLQKIYEEEGLQKEMLELLMMGKDARHKRITSQISLIEQELAELTLVELEQRQIKLDTQLNTLTERRRVLTDLLLQLFDEKLKREKELQARLAEMEDERNRSVAGYWLVHYQRLLDSKPQSLVDQEIHLEYSVERILDCAGAGEYLPQFAHDRVTIETLLQMNDEDLIRMGIHQAGLRRAVLREAENYREEEEAAKKKLNYEKQKSVEEQTGAVDGEGLLVVPGACARRRLSSDPGVDELSASRDTGPEAPVTARGINTQCVICLDAVSAILFLPCGHVCTCQTCSNAVVECPLDRGPIERKVLLIVPTSPSGEFNNDDDLITFE